MKKGLLKISLGLSMLLGSYIGVAQPAVQPLSYGFVNGQTISNWYADYVGVRFTVTTPSYVAGEKLHSDATTADGWGLTMPLPIITNVPVIEAAPDSLACTTLQNGSSPYPSMLNKVALIYRGTCEFGCKAQAAQAAGAIAVLIINNQPNGVVGMAGGTCGPNVTIPVYMISEADGNALDAAIHNGDTVRISITNWGRGLSNDLGFVFNGASVWHDFAIPKYEMGNSNGTPAAYKQVNGAYIANFGTNTEHNVKLSSTLQFTPTGGSTSLVMSDTTKIDSFPAIDSIVVMYMNGSNSTHGFYDVHSSSNGRFDLTYNVSADEVDSFPQDNVTKSSFYTTDSIYSKGTYDFTNGVPLSAAYINGFTNNPEAMAGPMYYINSGGHYAARTQFSTILIPGGTAIPGGILPTDPFPIYLFQWVDSPSTAYHDSLIEAGELQEGTSLVGVAQYTFNGTTDSSWETFSVDFQAYPPTPPPLQRPALMANSWYWVAADMPQSYALGYDGYTNYYPRSFGVVKYMGNKEYWANIDDVGQSGLMAENAGDAFSMFPFGGTSDVDSVYFSSEKQGLTPSLPLITSTSIGSTVAVKNIVQQDLKLNVYPNPTSEMLYVSVDLPCVAKSIFYDVISSVGRKVTSEAHHNLQNDKFTLDTRNLAPGRYYVTVIADNTITTREFTVLKH